MDRQSPLHFFIEYGVEAGGPVASITHALYKRRWQSLTWDPCKPDWSWYGDSCEGYVRNDAEITKLLADIDEAERGSGTMSNTTNTSNTGSSGISTSNGELKTMGTVEAAPEPKRSMRENLREKYPLHHKAAESKEKIRMLGDFMLWLRDGGYLDAHFVEEDRDGRDNNRLIFGFLGLDERQMFEERLRLLEELDAMHGETR